MRAQITFAVGALSCAVVGREMGDGVGVGDVVGVGLGVALGDVVGDGVVEGAARGSVVHAERMKRRRTRSSARMVQGSHTAGAPRAAIRFPAF
jgi:hypothetical protein